MNLPAKSTPSGNASPRSNISQRRLCAASRPVKIVPLNKSVSPTFQFVTSLGFSVSKFTRRAALTSRVTTG